MITISPEVWETAMGRIRTAIGDEMFDTWLKKATLEDFDPEGASLVMGLPNDFYLRWVSKRYREVVQEAFADALGVEMTVELVANESLEDAVPGNSASRRGAAYPAASASAASGYTSPGRHATPPPVPPAQAPTPLPDVAGAGNEYVFGSANGTSDPVQSPRLNARYSFDEFVVGESNRFAYSSAVAVADPRGRAFNPLFIYGASGLGKTHLMQAIGHKVFQTDPRLRVMYVTSESFINGFIDAIQNKRHVEFRAAYRNVDLLLIDDVQFLMGKDRTQQEFFHTFNALYDAGKKVVVTSDRPPRDLAALEERLRSRFEWGLLVDIQMPDLETRMAILRKKAKQEGVSLSSEVSFFIAENVTQNVREMEGMLKRLKMAATMQDRAIDLAMARDVLGHLMVGSPQPRISIEDVQRAVCRHFGISLADLLGNNRAKKFSQPRHLAQYLCRKLTDFSFPDIAQKFGGKDHTSIIYACRKVQQAMTTSTEMAGTVEHLSRQITKGTTEG